MAHKSTNAEIIKRTHWVMDALLDGLSNYEICRYASETWGVTKRTAERYMRWANTRIKREAEKDEAVMFDRVRRRLMKQYRRAIQKEDGHLARLLLRDIRELYGFDKPKKYDVDLDIEQHISIDETRQRVLEKLDQLLAGQNGAGNGRALAKRITGVDAGPEK